MIVDNGRYYIYRHIRPDKDIPFYIGRGKKPSPLYPSNEHCRAYSKTGRSKIWKDIVSKNNGVYEVEILLECNDFEFLKEKEIEFVKLYGRINLGTGILSNLTDGGDGGDGCIASEETRRKISENNHTKGKFGKDHPRAKKVYQYSLNGDFVKEWDALHEVKRAFNLTECPDKCLTGKTLSYHGYMWFYEYKGEKIEPYTNNAGKVQKIVLAKPVYQYDIKGNFIKEWDIRNDVQKVFGIKTARISEACKRNSHFFGEYFWFDTYQGDKINSAQPHKRAKRKILKLDRYTDAILEEFDSLTLAAISIKNNKEDKSRISDCCNGRRKTAYDFKWSYKN